MLASDGCSAAFSSLFISGIEEANPEALMEAARAGVPRQDGAVQPRARADGRRRRAAEEPGQGARRRGRRSSSAASSPTTAPATWSSPARSRASCRSSRPISTTDTAGAEGDRRGLPGEPAAGEGRAARVRGQGPPPREAALAGARSRKRRPKPPSALASAAFKVGDLGDTMKNVEEVLQKRYEVSAGKARVAKDMVDMDAVQEKENERKALEQVALAEFLASQGIQAPPRRRARRRREGDRTEVTIWSAPMTMNQQPRFTRARQAASRVLLVVGLIALGRLHARRGRIARRGSRRRRRAPPAAESAAATRRRAGGRRRSRSKCRGCRRRRRSRSRTTSSRSRSASTPATPG